jgi:hypothetical protein
MDSLATELLETISSYVVPQPLRDETRIPLSTTEERRDVNNFRLNLPRLAQHFNESFRDSHRQCAILLYPEKHGQPLPLRSLHLELEMSLFDSAHSDRIERIMRNLCEFSRLEP